MKMNWTAILITATLALTVLPALLFAQGPPPPPPPQSVPVDGGLGLLLAAGAALGTKKLQDTKSK